MEDIRKFCIEIFILLSIDFKENLKYFQGLGFLIVNKISRFPHGLYLIIFFPGEKLAKNMRRTDLMKKSHGQGRHQETKSTHSPSRFPHESDIGTIPSKRLNVISDPFQSQDLIM